MKGLFFSFSERRFSRKDWLRRWAKFILNKPMGLKQKRNNSRMRTNYLWWNVGVK